MGPPTLQTHEMLVSQLLCPESFTWNREKLVQLLPAYEETILEIKPSQLGARDKYVWLASKNGEYSAKSGYQVANKKIRDLTLLSCNQQGFNWHKEIWKLNSAPKVILFLWKAMQNAIPIGENLKVRGINTAAACPHCGLEESVTHLFFLCNFVNQVWEESPFKQIPWFGLNTSLRTVIEASRNFVALPPTGLTNGALFPWILWSIWTTRNKKIFEDRQVKPAEVITQALVQAREWLTAQRAITSSQSIRVPAPSPALQMDTIQVFSDAAWKEESHKAGFGWVMLDRLRD